MHCIIFLPVRSVDMCCTCGTILKIVPHVQHDYFSSCTQSNHWFLALSLPFPSSFLKLPIVIVDPHLKYHSVKYMNVIYISQHGKILTQQIDLASNVWLHSSVGRASHRYHRISFCSLFFSFAACAVFMRCTVYLKWNNSSLQFTTLRLWDLSMNFGAIPVQTTT